jgi:hypothetical protein
MKFNIVFENSGDTIPFKVVYNQQLFEFFVCKTKENFANSFFNNHQLSRIVDQRLRDLHWAISKTNEVLHSLTNSSLAEHTDLIQYLDQDFLNQTHESWVFSQNNLIDVQALKLSSNASRSQLGYRLHDNLSDDNLHINLAHAMQILGHIHPYEEVNMGVHRLETAFTKNNLEFSAKSKWDVFENPFVDTMVSNNDIVNFSFGYTYVGRQYYNKFEYFDSDLKYKDHYNYETLEYSFHLNLNQPQTIPFRKELLEWSNIHGIRPMAVQLPIANCVDLDKNLFEYRKILYKNSKLNNAASIILH